MRSCSPPRPAPAVVASCPGQWTRRVIRPETGPHVRMTKLRTGATPTPAGTAYLASGALAEGGAPRLRFTESRDGPAEGLSILGHCLRSRGNPLCNRRVWGLGHSRGARSSGLPVRRRQRRPLCPRVAPVLTLPIPRGTPRPGAPHNIGSDPLQATGPSQPRRLLRPKGEGVTSRS